MVIVGRRRGGLPSTYFERPEHEVCGAVEEIYPSQPTADRTTTKTRSVRILLVDDLEDVRESCREMLTGGGHVVTEAGCGCDAIAKLAPGKFDLVITDLGMPDVSGFEVALEAKRRSPGLPVILLSGWALDDTEGRIDECAIDRVLAKPCSMAELLRTVDETVRSVAADRPGSGSGGEYADRRASE